MKRVISYWVSAILAGASLWLLGTMQSVDYNPEQLPVVTGCVIRFYPTGPEIHENSAHKCTGANSVSVNNSGDLFIESDWHGAVLSIAVSPDESLIQRGIIAGASDGLGKTVIKFWSTKEEKHIRADSSVIVCKYCNLWITWIHEGP